MALLRGDEHFTMFKFTEDNNVFNRRLHRITLQDRTGKVHILEGKELPHSLSVVTSKALKGRHIGDILTKPGRSLPLVGGEEWPSRRDVLHGFAAIVLFMLMRHFAQLASAQLEPASLTSSSYAFPPFLPGSEKESVVLPVYRGRGKSRESVVAWGDYGLSTRVPARHPFTDGGDDEPFEAIEFGSTSRGAGQAKAHSKPRT